MLQIWSNLFGSGSGSECPKKTGSGSYLDMFLMFSKINNFLCHFYTKSQHFMTLKIKDNKIILSSSSYEILHFFSWVPPFLTDSVKLFQQYTRKSIKTQIKIKYTYIDTDLWRCCIGTISSSSYLKFIWRNSGSFSIFCNKL